MEPNGHFLRNQYLINEVASAVIRSTNNLSKEELFSVDISEWTLVLNLLSSALHKLNNINEKIQNASLEGSESFDQKKVFKLISDREQAAKTKGNWSRESDLLEEYTKPLRKCSVRVSTGELDGVAGYYTHYSINGQKIFTTFVKTSNRSDACSYLDRYHYSDSVRRKSFRIPWKQIDAGVAYESEQYFWDFVLTRVANGSIRIKPLYQNLELLNPLGFYDCQVDLANQYGMFKNVTNLQSYKNNKPQIISQKESATHLKGSAVDCPSSFK